MIRHALACATLASLVPLLTWSRPAYAAAQTFNSALPVAAGDFVLREQFLSMQDGDDPSTVDRNEQALGVVSVLGYGVSPRLTLFAMQPWLHKQVRMTTPLGRLRRAADGLGDTTLLARYTAFVDNVPGRTWRISPYAGVTVPTGRDDARDAMGRLPQPLQPGSGAWGATGGVVSTWQTLDYEIDVQAQYQAQSTAHRYRFGDTARLDASLQYRLWPRRLGAGTPGFLYGVLETNWIHQGRDRSFGQTAGDTGGSTLWLDPGVQYVTRRFVLEAVVRLPVSQRLPREAVRAGRSVLMGFRINL